MVQLLENFWNKTLIEVENPNRSLDALSIIFSIERKFGSRYLMDILLSGFHRPIRLPVDQSPSKMSHRDASPGVRSDDAPLGLPPTALDGRSKRRMTKIPHGTPVPR
jgi:hypothetical protein